MVNDQKKSLRLQLNVWTGSKNIKKGKKKKKKKKRENPVTSKFWQERFFNWNLRISILFLERVCSETEIGDDDG